MRYQRKRLRIRLSLVACVLSGRSAHCAPARRIHRMPFNTPRLLRQGPPRPSVRLGISPINGSSTTYCSSVRSIAASS
jgi:hypothetical protein